MKRNNLKYSIIIPIIFTFIGLSAQNNTELWKTSKLVESVSKEKIYRNTIPQEFKLFTLNLEELNSLLADVPERFTIESSTIIEFPTKDGVIQKFQVYEASILAPSLQA